jgi:hypothetical protein
MALISPGVEVTVIDESTYQPTAVGTVPYVLLATAQDKLNTSGSIASGTTATNAKKLIAVSSQRELVSLFGTPTFQVDASDNPLHAHELNEYGLLAAYSALGVANKVYIQRADVDLAQLTGTSIRPTGNPVDGTYWLDLLNTNWGIYEWTEDGGFTLQTPLVITDADELNAGVPINSIGSVGSYAINALSTSNPVFYKRYDNTWVAVGSGGWQLANPTIVGSAANPTVVNGDEITINNTTVTFGGTSVSDVADDIVAAAITGVIATVNVAGQLEIRADNTASSVGNVSLPDGLVTITGNSAVLSTLGIAAGTYYTPVTQFSGYRNVPAWRTTDIQPRPYGSVWFKTSATGNGANWGIKEYNANLDSWVLQAAPLYSSDTDAIQQMDPVGGGAQIDVGSLYIKYDVSGDDTGSFKPYVKNVTGLVKVTSLVPTSPFAFTNNNSFIMEVSVPGSTVTQSATITLTAISPAVTVTAQQFVAAILAANLPNIVAVVESSGAISISHLAGGTIKFTQVTGTPLSYAGFDDDSNVQTLVPGQVFLASPFTALTYSPSDVAPYTDPADGTLWYYNTALEVDIMINDGSGWKGYKNVANDARGYDLSATDELGPILSASRPTTQVNGAQLVPGDLWIDTGDLENYPRIYRYTDTSVWELIDNTDQVSVDGIVFADARWGTNGSTNPIVDEIPNIAAMQSSDYLDPDAPDYRLFARGTLLFNTRRSGYGVKRFESKWFANEDNPPSEVAAWVSNSGVDENQVPYFGSKAQRNVVVEAMKAAIESSTALREEQTQFNLICCPGYPELIQNMITLNNDRKQTAFIIGDAPLTLQASTQAIETWASNQNLAENNGLNGLVSNSEYLGVFYPAGLGTDLGGESVVVPASHMMLRTIIRSDNISYPWFAPAGVRRGLIDNVSAIGYVDTSDNNDFKSIGVTEGLRDVLYTQRVNPLTVLPGVGLVNYGQKTRAAMNSAMDRINVARLICYLRIVLDQVARPFIFEPNDTITRNQVKAAFESVLNDVVAKRGIYDYLVVCDTTNNTPDRIDRNELWIDIAIEPVKAIEFIYIPVRLKNTGAIAAGL